MPYGDPNSHQLGSAAGRTGMPGDVPGAVLSRPRKAGPVAGWNTEYASGALVLGSLLTLILLRRGFRGVTVKIGS